MIERSVPSEEKLLKLIRKKGASAKEKKKSKAKKEKLSGGNFNFSSSLKVINRGLILISLSLCVYILFKIFMHKERDVNQIAAQGKVTIKSIDWADIESRSARPYPQYAARFEERDIFDTSFKGKGPVVVDQPTVANPINDLKVVGIILDDQPQAIIENTGTNETFFLNKGDVIGEVVVEEIQESKVILLYQGQTFELNQ